MTFLELCFVLNNSIQTFYVAKYKKTTAVVWSFPCKRACISHGKEAKTKLLKSLEQYRIACVTLVFGHGKSEQRPHYYFSLSCYIHTPTLGRKFHNSTEEEKRDERWIVTCHFTFLIPPPSKMFYYQALRPSALRWLFFTLRPPMTFFTLRPPPLRPPMTFFTLRPPANT